MATAKEEVEELLGKLPNDCSLEDIQYHLYVLEKVRNGLEAAETEGVSQSHTAVVSGPVLRSAQNAPESGAGLRYGQGRKQQDSSTDQGTY